MNNEEILTIKSLEFDEFTAIGKGVYFKKKHIVEILDTEDRT